MPSTRINFRRKVPPQDLSKGGRRRTQLLRGISGYMRVLPHAIKPPEKPLTDCKKLRRAIVAVNPGFIEEFGKEAWPCLDCKGRGSVRLSTSLDVPMEPCPTCKGARVVPHSLYGRHRDDLLAKWGREMDYYRSIRDCAQDAILRSNLSMDDIADILEYYGVEMELEPRG